MSQKSKEVWFIDAEDIRRFNVTICEDTGNESHCYSIGKVESALHSAFYPGTPPFQHGGIAEVAGAMAYYLTNAHAFVDGNKRVAVASSLVFLRNNGYELFYQGDELADLIESCAAGTSSIEEVKEWYSTNLVPFLKK
jgi:death on curing protein